MYPYIWVAVQPFALGNFGGHAGRTLRVGDMIKMVDAELASAELPLAIDEPQALSKELIPEYSNEWEIAVLYGPHGAPDFFKPEYVEEFFPLSGRFTLIQTV